MSQDDQIKQFEDFVRQAAGAGMSRRAFLRRGLALGLSLPTVLQALAACGMTPPAPQAAAPTAQAPTAVLAPQSQPAGPTAIPTAEATAASLPTAAPTATPAPATRFAIIGDFGLAGEPEQAVAALVKSWNPEFIVTTGDNNYPDGAAETIDANIGQYYHEFIAPYKGSYGSGATTNRFFPVLGNHDWSVGYPRPYLDYFTLPEPQRYYVFDWGPARFFMLDSALDEPDGISSDSLQAQWLQARLAESQARWNIAVMHHPPFSSGHHGSSNWMQWPFHDWGVDLVLAGHDHNYERLTINGFPYIVNGLGGGARYAPGSEPAAGSQVFYNQNHGAMQVTMDATLIALQFVTRDGEVVDSFTLE